MPMVSAVTFMPRIAIQAQSTRAAHEVFGGEQEEHDGGEDKEYSARG
jgi:hypothetical protein